MKVLVVGGGGREHAIAWKLHQDDPHLALIAAPGNPGIAQIGRCESVSATDIDGICALAQQHGVDLVVVGPEAPLELGLVDRLRTLGIPAFGPTKGAAEIETSKRFAKELMLAAGVPTAMARTFVDADDAKAELRRIGAPVVVKASGIAAGKGVIVASTLEQAESAVDSMLTENAFGAAGAEVLIEEFMTGEELSVFALTDGTHVLPMIAAQDHKRIGEGDTGPNTGGMGAYAPVSLASAALMDETVARVFTPTLRALREMGRPFAGLLYAGLMLTPQGIKVVEFNCRFGDPETEAILPLMASSLLTPMLAIARGESLAGHAPITWHPLAAVTTVVAAHGYPDSVRRGDVITLPPEAEDVIVFHAGTARNAEGALTTAGGRVLAITALAPTLSVAHARSAAAAEAVQCAGKQFRRDIGWRELARGA